MSEKIKKELAKLMHRKPTYEELEQKVKELTDKVSEGNRSKALFEQTQNVNDLLMLAPFGVFIIDLYGKIIFVNKSGSERLGKNSKEMIGTFLKDYFPSEIAENRRLAGVEAIKSEKTQQIDDRIGDRWYSSKIFPLKDKNNNISSLAIYGIDVTKSTNPGGH